MFPTSRPLVCALLVKLVTAVMSSCNFLCLWLLKALNYLFQSIFEGHRFLTTQMS